MTASGAQRMSPMTPSTPRPWPRFRTALLELVVQEDRVDGEEHGHEPGQPRHVALDDVRPALRHRRDANAAQARLAARPKQHEHQHGEREADLMASERGD